MQLISIFYFMIARPITHPLPFPQMTGHQGSTRRVLLPQLLSTSLKKITIMESYINQIQESLYLWQSIVCRRKLLVFEFFCCKLTFFQSEN